MGNLPAEPERIQQTSSGRDGRVSYALSSVKGWRLYMEDAHLTVCPFTEREGRKNHLFGIFDGHGGPEIATFVSRHFGNELKANQNYQGEQYEQALRQTFLRMDQLISLPQSRQLLEDIHSQMLQSHNCSPYQQDYARIGCTANVLLVTPTKVYCANAGDSRAVAMLNGTVFQLSRDHLPTNPIELARITKAGGTVTMGRINGGLNLSRALGDLGMKQAQLPAGEQLIIGEPDITVAGVEELQFIIMGCDGIWQTKKNAQMLNHISREMSKRAQPLKIVSDLVEQLIARDTTTSVGCDNMTAILISFQDAQ